MTFRRLVFSCTQIDSSGQGLIAQHLSRSAIWSPYNSTKRFVIFQNFSTTCGRIQRSFLEFTRRCRFLENIFITEMAMSTEMLSNTVYRLQLDEICLFVHFRLRWNESPRGSGAVPAAWPAGRGTPEGENGPARRPTAATA